MKDKLMIWISGIEKILVLGEKDTKVTAIYTEKILFRKLKEIAVKTV